MRGGFREGAGRKSTGRHKVVLSLTDYEESFIRKWVFDSRQIIIKPAIQTVTENNTQQSNILELHCENEIIKQLKLKNENEFEKLINEFDNIIYYLELNQENEITTLKLEHKNEIDKTKKIIKQLILKHENEFKKFISEYDDIIYHLELNQENEIINLKLKHKNEIDESNKIVRWLKSEHKNEFKKIIDEYNKKIKIVHKDAL